jgi:phosphoglycolate phosphatase
MVTMKPSRLVVFDCDGTLVDSQHHITDCMAVAFREHGLAPPPIAAVRNVVGLNLAEAIARLVPLPAAATVPAVTESYRKAFFAQRQRPGALEPLFDGAAAAVAALLRAGYRLGIATGKSRRGLEAVLAGHGLLAHFVTLQTPDVAPGKPDPAMLHQAIAAAGAAPSTTVMVGDTTFDIVMARRAEVAAIGVAWGYHDPADLVAAGAATVIEAYGALPAAVAALIGEGG